LERSAQAPVSGQGFTPGQIADLYNFPRDFDGDGQCIGIISLGGNFQPAVLDSYFRGLGLPTPEIVRVSVEGANGGPAGTDETADGETMLDIEIAGAIAPKARIVVYTAPNSTEGFIDAITTAIHDAVNQPSVISISWGNAEVMFTAQARSAFDQAFAQAVPIHVTILCSVGDKGSSDGIPAGRHVDFPASSPYVIACGGTKVTATDPRISEVVWNNLPKGATGGGVSDYIERPDWQANLEIEATPTTGDRFDGRIIPDVAANADPDTGYRVLITGDESHLIGGTSAVPPLLAGLIARINQSLSRQVGYLNPLLYEKLALQKIFNDVTEGNNFGYSAKPGYDACTGWGSIDGTQLLHALEASSSSSATDSRE
jgi:kumamolisin